jgi:broad specificity phosphatase PhoE
VHLVRHGEVHNPDGLLYGRLPGYRLSERGRAQAELVAADLADHDVMHVVSSPLERAQETSAPIASAHRLEVAADDRLIEAANSFEGLRVAVGDGALRQPRYWSRLYNPFRPSWGEPYLRIAHRMLAAVHRARAVASGHEAVCVSHQLPIWTLRRFLEGRRLWHDPRRRQCSLASLTSIVFNDEEIVDIAYSEPAGATDPRKTGA